MEKYNLKNKANIKLHNILFATTTKIDYEMQRLILLKDMPDTKYDEFVLVEGGHCSCYDFDDTEWSCTKLTKSELNKLLEMDGYLSLRKELKDFLWRYYNYEE